MEEIRTRWKDSKRFRTLVIVALIYAVLRMAAQAILLSDMTTEAANAPEGQVASDLQIYVNAARHFANHEDLYLKGSLERLETHYPYSPAFAAMFMPILLLPLPILVPLDVLFHIVAYAIMYFKWGSIFKRLQLTRAAQALVNLLPLWIVFSAFWDDVAYLNIYIIMALVGTLFIEAILEEKLGWAIFWLGVIIIPIKPQWAFAAALPLLLGRRRFFLQLVAGSALAYIFVAGATTLIGGVEYGLRQYSDYIGFLARLSRDFPWRGPEAPFLGYNHSVVQTVVYYLGVSPTTMRIATLVKLVLLLPFGWIGLRHLIYPINLRGNQAPRLALDLGFALYLGAFLWLDMVWEVSLSIAIFTYLLGTLDNKKTTVFLWVVFFPYALADVWRLLSYIIFGDAILYDGAYVLSDLFIYLPWISIVTLSFYAVILARLASPKEKVAGPAN